MAGASQRPEAFFAVAGHVTRQVDGLGDVNAAKRAE